jgi:hypothetical protein
MLPIQKNSLSTRFFLSSPDSTSNILSREIGGKPKLVPRLHSKHRIYQVRIKQSTDALGLGAKS